MRRIRIPHIAATVFVVLVAGLLILNAVALERQRSNATTITVAAHQQALADRYLADVVLAAQGTKSDPDATMKLLLAVETSLRNGGPVPALQGSPDGVITIPPPDHEHVRAKLAGQLLVAQTLHEQGQAFLRLAPGDPRRASRLRQLRVTAAQLGSTTRDVVGEMTEESNQSVDGLVRMGVWLGGIGVAAALGIAALFQRMATRGASARFQSLVTNATDLVLTTDRDRAITFASPSSAHVLGHPPEALVGTAIDDFIHHDSQLVLTTELATILDTPGASTTMECRVRHADGRWLDLRTSATNLLLDPTVRGLVFNAYDVTEQNRLIDELAHKAFHDDLTGLANRALLRDRLEHSLQRSQRSAATVALLFCDLDGFKMINDSLGHEAGDMILVEVARRLEQHVRDGDTTARLGGDEFAVLVDAPGPDDERLLARRLLDVLREPFHVNGQEVYIRASIGISDNREQVRDAEEMLLCADIAMYAAKARGRDRYARFEASMQSELVQRHELHDDLRRALDHAQLSVHYQPLVGLEHGEIHAFEALLRWTHPERGAVGPDEFIPLAEETGLILSIGEFVLREACGQIMEWRREFDADFSISVNVAAQQLHDVGFVPLVQNVLTLTQLPPSSLVLELTETTLLSDTVIVQQRLRELKALGVEIAIDDFGTGYSSLAYLSTFPVDFLKIDKSFIDELRNDAQQGHVMVRSIIGLGHNLSLQVVAEGIEDSDQLDELRASGCNIGQGYIFSRPLEPAAAAVVIAEHRARTGTLATQPG